MVGGGWEELYGHPVHVTQLRHPDYLLFLDNSIKHGINNYTVIDNSSSLLTARREVAGVPGAVSERATSQPLRCEITELLCHPTCYVTTVVRRTCHVHALGAGNL